MKNLIKDLRSYSIRLKNTGYLKQASLVSELITKIESPISSKPISRVALMKKASALLTILCTETEKSKLNPKIARIKYMLQEVIKKENA